MWIEVDTCCSREQASSVGPGASGQVFLLPPWKRPVVRLCQGKTNGLDIFFLYCPFQELHNCPHLDKHIHPRQVGFSKGSNGQGLPTEVRQQIAAAPSGLMEPLGLNTHYFIFSEENGEVLVVIHPEDRKQWAPDTSYFSPLTLLC